MTLSLKIFYFVDQTYLTYWKLIKYIIVWLSSLYNYVFDNKRKYPFNDAIANLMSWKQNPLSTRIGFYILNCWCRFKGFNENTKKRIFIPWNKPHLRVRLSYRCCSYYWRKPTTLLDWFTNSCMTLQRRNSMLKSFCSKS